eukprot:TRINITY_DN381_c0_g2_i6.p1 TRINITY_DN381_c0_g2~~TRINITY_DN381_c0_g2_i6.p1  ORF type:complete len:191 (+),score=43.25 TRINITY_DN381_c0_g2_i6:85-657(+)
MFAIVRTFIRRPTHTTLAARAPNPLLIPSLRFPSRTHTYTTTISMASSSSAPAAPAPPSITNTQLFINGRRCNGFHGNVLPVFDPSTGTKVAHVHRGGESDVKAAVTAAHAAFYGEDATWPNTSGAERAAILRRIAALVNERKSTLATLEAFDSGKPVPEAEWDIDDVAGAFEYCTSFRFCFKVVFSFLV